MRMMGVLKGGRNKRFSCVPSSFLEEDSQRARRLLLEWHHVKLLLGIFFLEMPLV